MNDRLIYYRRLCDELYDMDNFSMIRWMYRCVEMYDIRYKSYSNDNKLNDNIIYILLYSFIDKIENYDLDKYLDESIEIYEIKYDNVKYVNLINILILKMINISVYFSIDEIKENNEIIKKNRNIINELDRNDNIMNQFEIIKSYLKTKNIKIIKKLDEKNEELSNKLNKNILESIYSYYVNLLNNLLLNKMDENSIFYSNIILNVLDYYIFYCKKYKYIYKDNVEKNSIFIYMCNLFKSKWSNININIKLIDFYIDIIDNEMLYIISVISKNEYDNNDFLSNLVKNLMLFFVELDSYDDYYKIDIKYRIVYLCNNVLNKLKILKSDLNELVNNNDLVSRFVLNIEMKKN